MKLSVLLAVRISRCQYFKFLLQSYAFNSNKPHVLSVNRKFILSRLCWILISFQLKHKFSIFFGLLCEQCIFVQEARAAHFSLSKTEIASKQTPFQRHTQSLYIYF